MSDIETRLNRIEAELWGHRPKACKPELLPVLFEAYGRKWFTLQEAYERPEVAAIVGPMGLPLVGRQFAALGGIVYRGLRLRAGALHGKRRFRVDVIEHVPALTLTAYGPVHSGKSHLLRRIVEALGAEYRFDLDVERNTLSVRQMCINGVWRDGI